MKLVLKLDYSLVAGWLVPYISGLKLGRAVAAHCMACDAVSFPPLRVCACGGGDSTWETLAGTATVIWRATGLDGDFALMQFDGATTSSVARLHGMKPDQTSGRIVPAITEPPGLLIMGDEPGVPDDRV